MNHYSQAGQDRFVEELILKHEPDYKGTFLDIGCSGQENSNTLALEEIGWTGLLIDVRQNVLDNCPRKNPFVCADASLYPFESKCYDYISLDVDGCSLRALANLLARGVTFRVMTAEHDQYAYGPNDTPIRPEMRRLLDEAGYFLICADVCGMVNGQPAPFEDWWCHVSVLSRAARLNGMHQKYWEDIFK